MRKISKNLIFMVCAAFIFGSSLTTFATSVDNSSTKRAKHSVEKNANTDMVIGKITSIDAEKLTIEIATRKEREKKDITNKETDENQTERKKPSFEDRYVLTGESKTYNIALANFGRKPDETSTIDSTKEKEKGIAMTYADYKVGDYIRITVEKENPTVAKRIRSANQGFNEDKIKKVKGNYTGGYKGSYTGKTKAEKQGNS